MSMMILLIYIVFYTYTYILNVFCSAVQMEVVPRKADAQEAESKAGFGDYQLGNRRRTKRGRKKDNEKQIVISRTAKHDQLV